MKYPTGALLNPKDNRDLSYSQVVAGVIAPPIKKTDTSMLPIKTQYALGICVGMAHARRKQYKIFKQTGQVVDICERWIYSISRQLTGLKPADTQGAYPRDASLVGLKAGYATTKLIKDDKLWNHADYATLDITADMIDDAFQYQGEGVTFVDPTLSAIRDALFREDLLTITVPVGDWSTEFVHPPFQAVLTLLVLCFLNFFF